MSIHEIRTISKIADPAGFRLAVPNMELPLGEEQRPDAHYIDKLILTGSNFSIRTLTQYPDYPDPVVTTTPVTLDSANSRLRQRPGIVEVPLAYQDTRVVSMGSDSIATRVQVVDTDHIRVLPDGVTIDMKTGVEYRVRTPALHSGEQTYAAVLRWRP